MEKLTNDQKVKITMDMLTEQPLATIGQFACLKLGEEAIIMNAENVKLTTDATILGKRYEIQMEITYKLV